MSIEDRSDGKGVEKDARKRTQQHNVPSFDFQSYLYRMTGVDLTKIDGIDAYTVLKVIMTWNKKQPLGSLSNHRWIERVHQR